MPPFFNDFIFVIKQDNWYLRVSLIPQLCLNKPEPYPAQVFAIFLFYLYFFLVSIQ